MRRLIFEKPKSKEVKVTSMYPAIRYNKLGQKFLFYSATNFKEVKV